MEELKIVYEIIVSKDKNILLSEIQFSNREIYLEKFINTYKVRKNIAMSIQNLYLIENYANFINDLEKYKKKSINKIKLAYIMKDKNYVLYVFDSNLLKLISILKLMRH